MTETVDENTKVNNFINDLQTKILKDVAADKSKPVAIMVIPGSFNPIHKGHLAMFDKAYKKLMSENGNTLIYGVYVVADDEWVKAKIKEANDPEITAITSTNRINLCSEAFSDYKTNNPTYEGKLFVYPVAKNNGTAVIDKIMDTIIVYIQDQDNNIAYDVDLITGYIVCGSDHIYDPNDPKKGEYLWGYNVIAIVRKDDVDKINAAETTTINIGHTLYTLSERWTILGYMHKSKKTIWFIQPIDGEIDAEMSSSLVRKYLKEGATTCDISKKKLHELLTPKVYDWIMKNIMFILNPKCIDAQIEAVAKTDADVAKTEAVAKPDAAKTEAVSEAAPVPRVETESVAESEAESVAPVLVPISYFISIHFKTGDPWTFYRCLMRGYLISTYIASYVEEAEADDTNITTTQIQRAMYNSAETVMHADNVFHFDDVIISEYDAIIGMLTRMSRWFKFKLDQSVPRKAFSSVEDGSALMSTADYFVHQLDAAFKVVDTADDNTTTTMMSINEFMDDLTADINNANSSKVLAAWDATRRAAAATRRAPGAAWTATKSAARSVAGAVSGMASRANATRKNVSASVDKSVADSAESFAARRRAVADASAAAAAAKAGGGRQVALQQMKQTGGAYKNAEAFAGMMTKLKQYVGDDGAPANKPAMLADEYFERLSKVVAGVSSSRPSIFGHPLLLYLPFARAFNCVIYVYKPSQSDTGNYILKYIFRGAETGVEEVEEEEEADDTKEVHEIHILDKNPDGDGSAFLDESYSSRFALLVLSGNSGTVGSDSTSVASSTGVASSTAATTDASSGLLSTSTNVSPHVKTGDASVPVIDDKSKSDVVFKPTTPPTLPPSLSGVHDNDIIIYNKYDEKNPTGDTSIGAESFYLKLANLSGTNLQNIKVYLTNGANTEVLCRTKIKTDTHGKNILDAAGNIQYEGDGGTSGAFARMALSRKINELCVPNRYVNVFNPNNGTFDTGIKTIINDSTQVANVKVGTTTTYPAGSVFKLVIISPLTNENYPVYGAYHIKGINWGGVAAPHNETMSVPLVKAYYTAILDDVLKNEATENGKTYIVHLAQIPGTLFLGTKITADAMHDAVNEWIVNNSGNITLKKKQNIGIRISIDYLKPAPVAPTKPAITPAPVVAKPAIKPKPVSIVDPNSIRVMTFNTCWEALDAKASGTLDMKHCGTNPNTCRSNINTVIKKGITDKYDFILLQEMTSDFDTDLVGTAKNTTTITSSDFKNVFEYEFANELYTGYGYKFLLKPSNMGILSLKKADMVVVGNLSAIPYDRPSTVIYGGSRPFMILVFNTDKRIVMNVHAPQPRKFMKDISKKIAYTNPEILKIIDDAPSEFSQSDIDNKQVISQYHDMQKYAFFYVIPNAIQTKLGLSIEDLKTYQFIIAGDFNSDNVFINLNGIDQKVNGVPVSRLPELTYFPEPKGNVLNGNTYNTCAHPSKTFLTNYKNGALSDHILSNMKMETDSYKIFDGKIGGVQIPGILETPPKFSDHLPVYATITSEKDD